VALACLCVAATYDGPFCECGLWLTNFVTDWFCDCDLWLTGFVTLACDWLVLWQLPVTNGFCDTCLWQTGLVTLACDWPSALLTSSDPPALRVLTITTGSSWTTAVNILSSLPALLSFGAKWRITNSFLSRRTWNDKFSVVSEPWPCYHRANKDSKTSWSGYLACVRVHTVPVCHRYSGRPACVRVHTVPACQLLLFHPSKLAGQIIAEHY